MADRGRGDTREGFVEARLSSTLLVIYQVITIKAVLAANLTSWWHPYERRHFVTNEGIVFT
jgi:hypothetical protein